MATNSLANLSVQQLRRAIAIKEKIETLEQQLGQILGAPTATTPTKGVGRKRVMSAAARARIAAAQRARWAKVKGKPAPKAAKPAKRKVSAAARAKLSALAKARWKKAKAAGKTTLGA